MFLRREVRRKDGQEHVYYYLGRDRSIQQRLLNLGEPNATQIDRWQRSVEVIEQLTKIDLLSVTDVKVGRARGEERSRGEQNMNCASLASNGTPVARLDHWPFFTVD
jgi:hypothetical protein